DPRPDTLLPAGRTIRSVSFSLLGRNRHDRRVRRDLELARQRLAPIRRLAHHRLDQSILFTTMTRPFPASSAYPATCWSWARTPVGASITSSTTSERSMAWMPRRRL